MIDGVLTLPWWGYVAVTLVLTQITIASVTIYLHRAQAHRALDLHPLVAHFFRFWLWLTTGMVTKEWVAIHRKHHAKCETEEDPHSPQILGINTVLWRGAELYREAAKKEATVRGYGHGTPNDWLERRVYSRHAVLGLGLMLVTDVVLFGVYGITMWAVQMMWIPLFAAGVINGLGHYWGYRNFEVADASTNLTNVAFFIGGEELHNNHHAYPSSAKFSLKWWEFDIGWLYIRLISWLGLAKVKKVAPRLVIVRDKTRVDMDTLRAVIVGRMHIMAEYAKNVTLPVFKEQLRRADSQYRQLLKQARQALLREDNRVSPVQRRSLERALSQSEALQTVCEYRRRLQALWGRTYNSHEKLLQALQEWCQQAEATRIQVLQDFAQRLKGYALRPA
jgi:stearoyl-CoA desaturase (delta-9 desaturase)